MKKIFFALVALVVVGCGKAPVKVKPTILVSVEPHAEMVHQIAGNTVEIISVVPSGVDPHNWEPTIKHMTTLHGAAVWFCVGESFESILLKKLRVSNPELKKIELYQNIKRLPDPSGHCKTCMDNHIWLSPKLDIIQAETIATILADLLPEQKTFFANNLKQLVEKLNALDQELRKDLAPYAGKVLLTTHGAYTYFCNEYGLRQLVIEPVEGKEPKTKDITELSQKIESDRPNIIGVFLQPQHTNKAATQIAKNLKLRTYMVDPYRRHYIKTMEQLKDAVQRANH